MITNNNIQSKIDEVLNVFDSNDNVKVSPFFKDKTLDLLFSDREDMKTIWSWFTPQLQLVTLVCFLILNIYTFTQVNTSSYNDNISDFAETYGLSDFEDNSLFN